MPHAVPSVKSPKNQAICFGVWRSSRNPGVEIIKSNRHEHHYPQHLHDSLEIIWAGNEPCELVCRGRHFSIAAGEAAVILPNAPHGGGSSRHQIEFVAIHLPQSLLAELADNRDENPRIAGGAVGGCHIIPRDKAESLLPIVIRTLCAELPIDRLAFILRPILAQLLQQPLQSAGASAAREAPHPAVSMARSIIRDRCADHVQLQNLARTVDMDARYLIAMFKLATGVTPHQFRIAMRVELARTLIEKNLPLCEVAAQAGFSDQSHLNRHFRRQYGFSPGYFRESVVLKQAIDL